MRPAAIRGGGLLDSDLPRAAWAVKAVVFYLYYFDSLARDFFVIVRGVGIQRK